MSGLVAIHGTIDPQRGLRMLERQAHRGPDGSGHRQLDRAWLGSRFLSIVDPESGDQPVQSGRDGHVWVVGDGMIHNHRRIRDRLGADRFRTDSDLEAAALLYEDRGSAAFERLWGPFALAVADDQGGFAVARDILGLAPLYWVRTDDAVLFASEMSAFDAAMRPLIEPFPPGHVWTPEGGLEAFREFPGTTPVLLQSRAPDEDPPAWVFDAVRESLVRAVERCMVGRHPAGVLLSRGRRLEHCDRVRRPACGGTGLDPQDVRGGAGGQR